MSREGNLASFRGDSAYESELTSQRRALLSRTPGRDRNRSGVECCSGNNQLEQKAEKKLE